MKNHYLPAPDGINQKDFRQLPNRNSFAGLYFDSKASSYAKASNFKRKLSQNELKLVARVGRYFIVLGILIPLPFLIAKFCYEFLTQNLHVKLSITQPAFFTSLVICIAVFVFVYKKILDILTNVGYRAFFFCVFILICLLLITPVLYLVCNSFESIIVRELSFDFAIIILSIFISKLLVIQT